MKKQIFSGIILLCLCFIATADKIDKKGNILNSNCNPIGTKCSGSASAQAANYTFVYNEPHGGSFSMQFTEQEVLKNEYLKKVLLNKPEFNMEEDMQIEDDVIKALKMPKSYIVHKGKYPVKYANKTYIIEFHP